MTKLVMKTRRRSGSVVTTVLTPLRGVDCCNDRRRVRKDRKFKKISPGRSTLSEGLRPFFRLRCMYCTATRKKFKKGASWN